MDLARWPRPSPKVILACWWFRSRRRSHSPMARREIGRDGRGGTRGKTLIRPWVWCSDLAADRGHFRRRT
jgi:hypothetical protein